VVQNQKNFRAEETENWLKYTDCEELREITIGI